MPTCDATQQPRGASRGYDNRELLSTRTYMQGSGTLGTDVFTYAPNRLLLSTTRGLYNMIVSRGTANYDAANRLMQETQAFGGLSKSVSYAYTPDSLVSGIVYPDGTTVTRNYNNHRLLYQVLAGSTTQATFAYDPADRRSTMTYGNSAVTTWTLDNNSRVTNLAVTLGSGTLQAWGYGYSNAGDPLSQTNVTYGTMGEAYQYDGLHRLTAYQKGQITGSNSIAYPGASQAWQLTTGGDWSQWTSTVGTLATTDTRTHNNIHALTNRTAPAASTQLYDSDANQTDDGSQYKFVYDANDQLQQVLNRGTLAIVASYAYDAMGRRTQKYVASGGTTTNYFYEDQQVIEEYVNGGTAATYTYADGIDERMAMNRAGSLYYYHANRLGSTYLLSNSAAGIVEALCLSPYGTVAVSNSAYTSSGTVSSVGNPYLFTGRELDSESGLYNYRARTYDPVQGRFKQFDPIGLSRGANLFEYERSRPIVYGDPTGQSQNLRAEDDVVWRPGRSGRSLGNGQITADQYRRGIEDVGSHCRDLISAPTADATPPKRPSCCSGQGCKWDANWKTSAGGFGWILGMGKSDFSATGQDSSKCIYFVHGKGLGSVPAFSAVGHLPRMTSNRFQRLASGLSCSAQKSTASQLVPQRDLLRWAKQDKRGILVPGISVVLVDLPLRKVRSSLRPM